MTPKVSQYINRTILVSIPALFDDGQCRAYTLQGVELHGLWLQSEELTERLLPEDKQEYTSASVSLAVFVPFAQIAGVLVATRTGQVPPVGSEKPTSTPAARAKEKHTVASESRFKRKK